MFSPYYARARRREPHGRANPLDHCAINVALYGDGGSRWCMTERSRHDIEHDATTLRIGPSQCRWDGDVLTMSIDEVTVPWPTRLRGTVRVHAACRFDHPVTLAPGHRWFPIAPRARVEVDLSSPDLRWSGAGYLDANRGDGPLEQAFHRWDWSRAHLADSRSMVIYEVERVDASRLQVGLEFDDAGRVTATAPITAVPLPRTRWGIARNVGCDPDRPASVRRTLTDAPFYARSLVDTHWQGERVATLHESLSLARFDSPWVQGMLPFRMPRRVSRITSGHR